MDQQLAARVTFGSAGNARPFLRDGWSSPEDGFTWTDGPRGTLQIPCETSARPLWLVLTLRGFIHPPGLPAQTLGVTVNGHPVATARVGEPAALAFPLPAAAVARGHGSLAFDLALPTAARPSDFGVNGDTRTLGVAIQRIDVIATAGPLLYPAPLRLDAPIVPSTPHPEIAARAGLPIPDLLARFESLGDNCEFGLVQRRAGTEPLGLLRFASIKLPDLLRGLDTGFTGLGEPGIVRIKAHPAPGGRAEWMVHDPAYGIQYHTFILEGDVPAQRVLDDEVRRLGYLRRRLAEDLAAARKIAVLKRNEPLTLPEILPLLFALRERGDNALLYVVPADAAHPPGTVVALSANLFRGHVARFAPGDNAPALDLDPWIAVCANAHLLSIALRGDRHDG